MADIAALAILVMIVNFYIHPESVSFPSFLPGWLLDVHSISLIAVFLFLFGIKNLFAYLIHTAQQKFVYGVALRLSGKNLLQYLEGSFENYTQPDSSAYLRRISYEPLEFSQYVLTSVQQMATQSSIVLLAIVAILLFSAKLFMLLFIILLPPVILIALLMKKKLRTFRSAIKTNNEKTLQHLKEALAGYVESNIYEKNDFFSGRYLKFQQILNERMAGLQVLQTLPNRLIEVFAVLGLFLLIAISKWVGNNSIDLITIGAFMAAAYKIIPGIVHVMNAAGQLKVYGYTVTDLLSKEDRQERSERSSGNIQSIEFRNVTFNYKEQQVLTNCSFSIGKGDFLGISGLSGKGKTTLMNLLLGFLETQTGDILINDKKTSREDRKCFWKNISYVKQEPFLIHESILCNIVLDHEKYDAERLEKAICMSGLNEMLSHFPEGMKKIITENGKNISGGQRQRIAIARALYKKADLFILDEPFSELDEKAEQTLLCHFKELTASGKIVILITHDKKTLSYCTQILSLDEQA